MEPAIPLASLMAGSTVLGHRLSVAVAASDGKEVSDIMLDVVRRVAEAIYIPFSVGGGAIS